VTTFSVSVGTGSDRTLSAVIVGKGLHRFYKRQDDEIAALKDVTVAVYPGELVAIVGPSGSGKSTLLNLLAGLDDPDGGSVSIHGQRLSHHHPGAMAAFRGSSIGIMTQSSGLVEHLSVLGNVELAAYLRRVARRSSLAHSLGLDKAETREIEPLVPREWLNAVGLDRQARSRPSTLSGGETARANLAVALAGTPSVLLADEPTAEVSRIEEHDLMRLLRSVRPATGATIVVTHSDAVAGSADRVIEMVDGQLR
jgi:putative ABC transport system ATP-binding protein